MMCVRMDRHMKVPALSLGLSGVVVTSILSILQQCVNANIEHFAGSNLCISILMFLSGQCDLGSAGALFLK